MNCKVNIMATAKTTAPTATATTAKPEAAAPAAKPEKLVVLKRDLKFRGARQEWYNRLVAMDGKTRAEVLADLEAKRPSVYGAKSKHAGKPEPVAGWVRFYERNGYIAFKQ
jgi:hypothetical protein